MQKIKVERAKFLPEEAVYALQTESGVYLADRIVHHNCRICNRTLKGNYEIYEPKIKAELGIDNVQKLWDKAYSQRKIPTYELAEMLAQIKQEYKNLIEARKAKGWKC